MGSFLLEVMALQHLTWQKTNLSARAGISSVEQLSHPGLVTASPCSVPMTPTASGCWGKHQTLTLQAAALLLGITPGPGLFLDVLWANQYTHY